MTPGRNRILYRSSGWESGLVVRARLYDVSTMGLLDNNVKFKEMADEPIYYADVEFPTSGKYLFVFTHGGVRKASAVFEVGNQAGVVYRV